MDVLLVAMALVLGLCAGVLWAGRRHGAAAERARAESDRLRAAAAEREASLQAELTEAQRELDATRAEYRAWRASAEEQRRSDEQARKELEAAFAQLSQRALRTSSEQLVKLNSETLEQRQRSIDEMLKPFKDTLDKLQRGAQELEAKRAAAYGSLEGHLEALKKSTESLNTNSQTLTNALRGDARARGRWGEVTLRRVVELAGMTPHCDFTEQTRTTDGSRPDMIVIMPGGEGRIPVDAKVPMDAYMRAAETEDPGRRAAELTKHARDLRQHMRTLERKDYAESVGGPVDYTVMFVPGEPILAAAFEADPALPSDAMERRVLIATPVTLMALLLTVALYWRQSAVAENARRVWDEGREFHKRVTTFAKHFANVGVGLDRAVRAFDDAVGSYERRVRPQGRKLDELEAPGRADATLPELERIARETRGLSLLEGSVEAEDDASSDDEREAGDGGAAVGL